MKTISADFRTMLQTSTHLVKARLYTFTLWMGTVVRLTDAQMSLTLGGNTYVAGPLIEGDKIAQEVGIKVANTHLTLTPTDDFTVNGKPLLQAIARGDFWRAKCQINKFLAPSWTDTSRGAVNLFVGEVGDADLDRMSVQLTINDMTRRLNQQFPVNYIQPSCLHNTYDSGCTLVKADFTVAGAITGVPTVSAFDSDLAAADGYYDLGTIKFISGANAGVTRTIKTYVGGLVTLAYPLEELAAAGDIFEATAGDDQQLATCSGSTFNNRVNYRGFPFAPTPETIYSGNGTQAPTGAGSASPPRSGRGGGGGIKLR